MLVTLIFHSEASFSPLMVIRAGFPSFIIFNLACFGVIGVVGLVDAFDLNWVELGFGGDGVSRHQCETEAMR